MGEKSKILVLDDEYIIAFALAEDLKESGFDIAGPYTSADEAASNLDKDAPDAAFLDVNLGEGQTSYELGLTLLDKGVPFAFLTGYSHLKPGDERLASVKKLGKPISPDQSVSEAKALLQNRIRA